MEKITGTGVSAVSPASAPPTTAPAPASSPAPTPTGGDDDDDDSGGDDDSGDDHDDDNAVPETPADGTVSLPLEPRTGTVTVDGESVDYLFSERRVTDLAGGPYTVLSGASLGPQQSAVRAVTIAMTVGVPALLVVVGGVTWLVTRRALRPVEGIRREMAAITASEDLTRRVPEPGTHDEVAKLARTTNETLTALEASVDRQRRFVADASHELRSPIASLRTQLEVGRRTRSCWMCRARWPTPYGFSNSPPTCCCSPVWTRGSTPGVRGWIWPRWCVRRSRSARPTGSR